MEGTTSDVDEFLADVDEWNRKLNKQTQDHINEAMDDGTVIQGRVVQHGTFQYSVQASTDWRHAILESSFDVAQLLASAQAQARADGGHQGALSQPELQQAKQELRNNSTNDLDVIRREIIKSLSCGPFAFAARTDQDLLTGFNLERKIFPYDSDYSIKEYAADSQRLISAVYRGKEELIQRYDVRGSVSNQQSGPRGFQ